MPKTIALLLLFVAQMQSANAEEIDVGIMAPDFTINRLDGSQFQLSDFKNKKSVYLVFWTTWCTYCIKKIPKLKYWQKIYGKQIEIIAIDTSVKDTLAKAYKFQKQREITYPLAFDHGKKVTDLYQVWGTPTEFIIDINGKIIHRDHVPDNLSEHLSNWNMIERARVKKKQNTDNVNAKQI